MSRPEDNTIVVRLELHIPVPGVTAALHTAGPGGTSAQTLTTTSTAAESITAFEVARQRRGFTTVINPKNPAKVRVDNATGKKYVCADGNAVDGTTIAATVRASLNPAVAPGPIPLGVLPTAIVNPTTGYWSFRGANELEGALCSNGYPAPNVLYLWYEWKPGNYTQDIIRFGGVCSTTTDCGPVPPPAGGSPAGYEASFAGTAPHAWRVSPRGFGGQVTAFNGDWRLERPASSCDRLVWCGGGDGASAPRVELRYDCPDGTVWRLAFCRGDARVEYTHHADGWNSVGANTFTSLSTSGLAPEDGVPAALTVEPCR